jgi:mannose-6-phosphate isomerase-like protein (cupin superfamily)
VCRPGEGERFVRENRVLTILGDVEQLSVIEIAFDATFAVEPHVHGDHADSFYVLEGEVEFTVDDEIVRAGPGTFVLAPPGTRHGFRNPGPGEARVLNLHAPDAGFADGIRSY